MKRLRAVLGSALVFATTAGAQVVAPDSQAIAIAIARSLIPDSNMLMKPARFALSPGTIVRTLPSGAVALDSASRWGRMIRSQLRAIAPDMVADSGTRLMLMLRLEYMELTEVKAVVWGSFSRCEDANSTRTYWMEQFHLTIQRSNGEWQPAKARPYSVVDGQCNGRPANR